ncbi:M14 family zinc carboxypeptidase [Halobacillus sp. B29]|uniref:M14 family zinc carboxypeptidase n=1 Tax=Halobacillus sp. B29 TaxID=3457432 RepID=UPI003FCC286C
MKKKILTVVSTLALCTSLAMPTYAAGNHPGTPEQQTYNSSGFTDYGQLVKKLEKIERSSQGRVDVEVVGQSNQGRDIYQARVGTGDRVILIESEIHGNEKTGTEAILNLLQHLGSSNSPDVKAMLEEVTLVTLPKMNPDASELDRRGNVMSWEEVLQDFPQLEGADGPTWNHYYSENRATIQGDDYASQPGFDVNRDFNPDLDYTPEPEDVPGSSSQPGWYITPEAQTVRDVYKDLEDEFGKVDVFVDLHHQGLYYVDGTSEPVTLSLSGQFVPDPSSEAGSKYAEYEDTYDYDFSRQLNLAAYDALQSMGNSPFDNITLYSQGLDLPGTALGSFALNGSGTVLFEVTGQTQSMGQKKKGMLVKAVETGLQAIIEGVADGSVDELDPERYEDIPETSYQPGI